MLLLEMLLLGIAPNAYGRPCLIGNEYLRTTRAACHAAGLKILTEVPIPQVESEKQQAMALLAASHPDAIIHVGFFVETVSHSAQAPFLLSLGQSRCICAAVIGVVAAPKPGWRVESPKLWITVRF